MNTTDSWSLLVRSGASLIRMNNNMSSKIYINKYINYQNKYPFDLCDEEAKSYSQ